MSCPRRRRPKDPETANKGLHLGFIVIVTLWLAFAILPPVLGIDSALSGQFGDTLGAANSLFSGLALIGMAYAVVLQRQVLDHAKAEAKENEKDRIESARLMARQADALLATGKLNAARSIMESLDHDAQTHVAIGGKSHGISKKYNYKKLLKIVINDFARPEVSPDDRPPEGASMFRRYLATIVREVIW
jgi:hypothetical protein